MVYVMPEIIADSALYPRSYAERPSGVRSTGLNPLNRSIWILELRDNIQIDHTALNFCGSGPPRLFGRAAGLFQVISIEPDKDSIVLNPVLGPFKAGNRRASISLGWRLSAARHSLASSGDGTATCG
jgi:hypothetical protein